MSIAVVGKGAKIYTMSLVVPQALLIPTFKTKNMPVYRKINSDSKKSSNFAHYLILSIWQPTVKQLLVLYSLPF